MRCDMTSTPGRGWTIFQRRVDGSVDFYRDWADYKNGFGKLTGEFWLGLDKIHRLSASGQNVLRVDLENFQNQARYATFETFTVGNENEGYILSIGQYTGKNIFNIERAIDLSQGKYRCIIRCLSPWEVLSTGLLSFNCFVQSKITLQGVCPVRVNALFGDV